MILGTGTGDFRDEMLLQYKKDKSNLDEKYRYLPHNQYLTFLIAFGLTGFAIILFSVIYPVVISKAGKNILFSLFLMIVLLSMAGEDTLETHTGVTFFAYFYGLFVFGKDEALK
jgi:O-antigen ligase